MAARRPAARSGRCFSRAADILNAAQEAVILAGRGALGAGAELLAIAERLRRRSSSRCSARRRFPTTAPTRTGGIGLLGTKPSQEALESCDTLLIVGIDLPVHRVLSASPDRPRRVQIDLDPEAHRPALSGRGRPGRRQRAACSELLPLLERNERPQRSSRGAQKAMQRLARADGRARHPHATSR